MTLAQLGAEVIRIDPIGGSADLNRWPLAASGASLYWAGLNKSKRSLTVDFRSKVGQNLILSLIQKSGPQGGIVVSNSVGRPWLDGTSLRRIRSDLIHVQIQGKPDGSPAVDYTVNADIGFPLVTGLEESASPVNHVLPAWDIACGLYGAIAVSAAVADRDRSGQGRLLTVSLQDVAHAMAGNLGFLAEAQLNLVTRPRIGNYLYGGFARDFSSQDGGRYMVVALTTRHWRELLRVTETTQAVDALEKALQTDFTVEDHRFRYREPIAGLVQDWFRGKDSIDVDRALSGSQLLWSRYRSFAEVSTATSTNPEPLMTEIDQPGVGMHWAPGLPIRSLEMNRPAEPSPTIGEDSATILQDLLGLDAQETHKLQSDGIVGGAL